MTDEQIRDLGPAFTAYLRSYHGFCNQDRTTSHLDAYCRALLTTAPRKTVEPNALASGVAVRTLQKFLTTTQWDHVGVRDQLQTQVRHVLSTVPAPDGLGTVGVIDETSVTKKGDHTPGVQRQYLGCVGKIDNGIVTVHLAVARGRYRTLLDGSLYLPQSWDADRPRCRAAGIPDTVVYRPKWWLALEQYLRATEQGLRFDWLTFDEGYGSKPAFVTVLAINRQPFAGEIPRNFAIDGRGGSSRWAAAVLPASKAQSGKRYRLTRETQKDAVWRAAGKVVRVNGLVMTLVVAWRESTNEVKYFLAWGTRSVRRVLRVGFRRWTVEHLFRVAKQEVGLMDYEGRTYAGLVRHLILSMVVLGFVSRQAERLRGEKPGDHVGASECRVESGVPDGVDPPPSGIGGASRGAGDSLSSAPQRRREKSPHTTAA